MSRIFHTTTDSPLDSKGDMIDTMSSLCFFVLEYPSELQYEPATCFIFRIE